MERALETNSRCLPVIVVPNINIDFKNAQFNGNNTDTLFSCFNVIWTKGITKIAPSRTFGWRLPLKENQDDVPFQTAYKTFRTRMKLKKGLKLSICSLNF